MSHLAHLGTDQKVTTRQQLPTTLVLCGAPARPRFHVESDAVLALEVLLGVGVIEPSAPPNSTTSEAQPTRFLQT